MAENTIKKQPKRNPAEHLVKGGYGFKKGQSGNPKGRPKGARNLTTLFNEAIEVYSELAKKKGIDLDVEIDIMKKMLDKARMGDPHAMKLYMEYRFGKARHQEGDTLKIDIDDGFTPEEKEMMKQALLHAGLGAVVEG